MSVQYLRDAAAAGDGVSDALNAKGEEFGEERIIHCLTSLPRPMDAEGICKHLAGKVAEWATGAERFDDTTILALRLTNELRHPPLTPSLATVNLPLLI
jgi:Stage II sporulation protein E (SpoIIE)